jgi:hypothetical protein
MQAAQNRSRAHSDALGDSTAGGWCRGRDDEASLVGK